VPASIVPAMRVGGASVLLTGGSRGIGPHVARALLRRGARVTLAARSADDLEEVRRSLDEDRIATVAGDVTRSEDRARMVAAAEEAFGPVDILVNNAGIESVLPFSEYDEEEIRSIVVVNLDAPIQLTRLVVPGMVERGRGHIVNMASLAGKSAVPYNTVYSATKHGLIGFTYSLREELLGTGVSLSAVCPGYVTEVGLFARQEYRDVPSRSGAVTSPRKVAQAVVRAVERDKPDVVVAGPLPQLSDVVLALSPRFYGAAARRTGGYEPMRRNAEAEVSRRRGSA
jgi:short-subunit dehydrogenase